MSIDSCLTTQIDGVTIKGFSGTFGPGVYIKDSLSWKEKFSKGSNQVLLVKNSIFQDLKGWGGGALFIKDIENVTILNSTFINLKVIKDESNSQYWYNPNILQKYILQENDYYLQKSQRGGAILYDC